MSATSLYLVPTPIGNLGDMSYRAVEILKSVDVILAEDTRTSGFLLKHYGIQTPMQSFHAHNEHHKLEGVVKKLENGAVMALISDAGTPGISDPGFLLAREVLKAGLKVESLPGATAFVPALVKSGFPTDRFVFEGFLPLKKGRQTRLNAIASEPRTVVMYESPHKLVKTLGQLKELIGERQMSVSRELTKKFEETVNGTADELEKYFTQKPPKGEFVVVIDAKKE
jgi:16S rRNA (cytidine1402-2'-O)-methyltransferase